MRAAAAILLVLACGCGIKAPPRPPGVPAAQRGEEGVPCEGCQLPGPDAYPSPSTPSPSPAIPPADVPPATLEGAPDGVPADPEDPRTPAEGAPSADPAPSDAGPTEGEGGSAR
ncbi:MAG TPA: hypothetical protein VN033_10010 [Vulgatibacter sp.]|nr:hypothetical protein [Vulgatibacter sp.]